jgi:hypothetical protein
MKARPCFYQTNSISESSPEMQWLDTPFALHLACATGVIGQGNSVTCAKGGGQ